MKKQIAIYITLSLGVFFAKAQDLSKEMTFFSSLNQQDTSKVSYSMAKNNTNELQLVLSGAFLLYKHTISSQDASKCNFHVSCSEYAMSAVKKQGAVLGGVNFFDRFARCNSCSPYQYTIHPITKRFEDALE